MISLTTGVQRDIWYVCSVIRSLRGTEYCFLRFPYKISFIFKVFVKKILYLRKSYVRNDIHTQELQIGDHDTFFRFNLRMRN